MEDKQPFTYGQQVDALEANYPQFSPYQREQMLDTYQDPISGKRVYTRGGVLGRPLFSTEKGPNGFPSEQEILAGAGSTPAYTAAARKIMNKIRIDNPNKKWINDVENNNSFRVGTVDGMKALARGAGLSTDHLPARITPGGLKPGGKQITPDDLKPPPGWQPKRVGGVRQAPFTDAQGAKHWPYTDENGNDVWWPEFVDPGVMPGTGLQTTTPRRPVRSGPVPIPNRTNNVLDRPWYTTPSLGPFGKITFP